MKTRKILALLLAVLMLTVALAACQNLEEPVPPVDTSAPSPTPDPGDTSTPPETPPTGEPPPQSPQTLIVAYNGEMNGDFIEGFGNNAYDLSIKTLLHHFYATTMETPGGEWIINPTVVKDWSTSTDAAGNKTYTFEIHDDLFWSDGSQITAEDYVTFLIFQGAPAWRDVGATNYYGDGLLGYADYNRGYFYVFDADGNVITEKVEVEVEEEDDDGEIEIVIEINDVPIEGDPCDRFEGVKLLGPMQFSVTIDAENLPYFFETSYASVEPMCKAVYAPNVSIDSNANGAKFTGDITADAQRIAAAGGERFAPTVVSGPYTFLSFENQIATLQRNPLFKGDEEGRLPSIEYIVQMTVPEATDVDMLIAGEIDLLPAIIQGDKIERAKSDPNTYVSSYLRNGYGALNMVCDWGPTEDVNVRWAIACLIDRTQLLDQVLGGYGGLVDSEVGQSQWMFQAKRAELQDTLIPIALSITRANDYLDQSVWKFEADGVTPFDSSKANAQSTYLRHNSARQPLTINHAAASQAVGDILEIEFMKNTPLVGMVYNFGSVDFNVLLDHYYDGSRMAPADRIYSTYSMGTGFGRPYDPYYSWHSDWLGTDLNPTGVDDAELDRLIMAMRRLDPMDKDGYLENWFNYQVRWNQILPSVPLYSNEYFNLIGNKVQGVNTTPLADWYAIICEITKSA